MYSEGKYKRWNTGGVFVGVHENGCDQFSWISGKWHFPLIAYKYQSTIVIYGCSDANTVLEGEVFPNFEKRTNVYFPEGDKK
jgi:hypothetical protein